MGTCFPLSFIWYIPCCPRFDYSPLFLTQEITTDDALDDTHAPQEEQPQGESLLGSSSIQHYHLMTHTLENGLQGIALQDASIVDVQRKGVKVYPHMSYFHFTIALSANHASVRQLKCIIATGMKLSCKNPEGITSPALLLIYHGLCG